MARKKSVKKDAKPSGRELARVASVLPAGYAELLEDLKTRVRTAQLKAALSVNHELIQLYWDIGGLIVERQEREGWGTGVIDRLASDLQKAFPGLKGFSPSNVSRMRAFFLTCFRGSENSAQAVPKLDVPIFPQPVGKLVGPISAQPVPKFRGHGSKPGRRPASARRWSAKNP